MRIVKAYPRERFCSEVTLTPALVAAYARAAGDDNGPIASHYSKHAAMVGLEFWGRFRRPMYADETIRLEWLVVAGKRSHSKILHASRAPLGSRRLVPRRTNTPTPASCWGSGIICRAGTPGIGPTA